MRAAVSWREFEAELKRRKPVFWWRDDDATAPTPALERLLELSAAAKVPLALAVIPLKASPELFSRLKRGVDVLQHGADHVNRAAPGAKKSEFPPEEPAQAALERLAQGREPLPALARPPPPPVLAPPRHPLRAELPRDLP